MRIRMRLLLGTLIGLVMVLGLMPGMSSTALADTDINVSELTNGQILDATTDIYVRNNTGKQILVRVAETTGNTANDYTRIQNGAASILTSGKQYQIIEKDTVSNQLRCTFKPTTHSFTYSASGATITAACGNKSCVIPDGLTLTINAPELTVEGGKGSAQATVETGINWTQENGLPDVPSVAYYQGTEKLSSAPTTAGNYKAQITVGSGDKPVVAELEYVIKPPHTHSFTYSADGATITAKCGGSVPCDITDGLALAISAPAGDLVYDGTTTFPATLSTGYNTTAFPGIYSISYTKDGSAYDGEPKEAGAYTASVTVGEGDGAATASVSYTITEPQPEPQPAVALSGSGHVQTYGDVAAKESGKGISIGTTGEAKRLEQFSLSLPKDANGGIEYRAHLQGIGWGDWVQGGRPCGTTNEARRMEAVQMRLTGALAKTHSVWYRVHSQTWGTLGWAHDGQAAGTSGQAKRAEAIEVQVLPQGQAPEGYEEKQASYVGAVSADVHLQKIGWTGSSSALEFGTTGQARRLEAVRLSAPATPVSGGISYEAHVQREGWMPAAANGAQAGTTGQARRLEAVRISLTGEAAKKGNYSVWYRVHSQTFGWLGWTCDGEPAGTTGLAKRAEAIDVQVLPQGQVPRGYDASKGACVNG